MPSLSQDVSHLYDLDPEYVKSFDRVSETLGSNRGGMFSDPNVRWWYVKQYQGANAVDRTKNEKLVAELYKAAGVPHADTRMSEMGGQPIVAKPVVDGKELNEFDKSGYDAIKGLQENYPVDAWLLNFDVMGTHQQQ